MNTTITGRTLALAGLFQSARLVQELAREGRTDTSAFITSIMDVLAAIACILPQRREVSSIWAALRSSHSRLRRYQLGTAPEARINKQARQISTSATPYPSFRPCDRSCANGVKTLLPCYSCRRACRRGPCGLLLLGQLMISAVSAALASDWESVLHSPAALSNGPGRN